MSSKHSEVDYHEEGKKLLARVNLDSLNLEGVGRYDPLNVIYKHPTGGMLYVGGVSAAHRLPVLKEHSITSIVNCQGDEAEMKFSADPAFKYLHFTIGKWGLGKQQLNTNQRIRDYYEPFFAFVGSELANGKNVLVHCLAGAHRAGTAGISCLMKFANLDVPCLLFLTVTHSVQTATTVAKRARPAINPIGSFPILLSKLQKALDEERVAQMKAEE